MMRDSIVGMMFCHNEGDILEEILTSCLDKVDSWFIADDNSTDNSWDIIQSFKEKYPDKIEYTRNKRDNPKDVGQRQSLLDEIRKRYKAEDTWVQVLDADMVILDTDVRSAIEKFARLDMGVTWFMFNAVRKPGTWKEVDNYPNWKAPLSTIMPYAHIMEHSLYTFRPLPLLTYDLDTWRPWPQGFTKYTNGKVLTALSKQADTPLIAHYGHRGPTYFYNKNPGKQFRKYPSWDTSSVESVENTVYFFNGEWNKDLFPMSRNGWKLWREENERRIIGG